MARKRFEMNDDVEKLVNKYLEMTNCNLDELTNKALRYYIAKQLGSKEVREALKKKDPDDLKFLDEMNQHYLNSQWNM